MASWIKEKQQSAPFFGANSSWLEQYYDLYLQDPESVTPELQQLFQQFDGEQPDIRHQPVIERFLAAAQQPAGGELSGDADHAMKQAAVLRLINSYRLRGHQKADLDPIDYSKRPATPDLELSFHGLSEADLKTRFNTGSMVTEENEMALADIIDTLEQVYCRHIGVEYMHITDIEKREWLQQRLEQPAGRF
ncbi:MAG: 2-oxoglutarate dehydrogenase E1 component, partial [Proteobacteria bacterium]|nr:2-oxoglutarate dehydrogenase E1 component [Pseudomonadota bacterium]